MLNKYVVVKHLSEKQPITRIKRPHYPTWVIYPLVGNNAPNNAIGTLCLIVCKREFLNWRQKLVSSRAWSRDSVICQRCADRRGVPTCSECMRHTQSPLSRKIVSHRWNTNACSQAPARRRLSRKQGSRAPHFHIWLGTGTQWVANNKLVKLQCHHKSAHRND